MSRHIIYTYVFSHSARRWGVLPLFARLKPMFTELFRSSSGPINMSDGPVHWELYQQLQSTV